MDDNAMIARSVEEPAFVNMDADAVGARSVEEAAYDCTGEDAACARSVGMQPALMCHPNLSLGQPTLQPGRYKIIQQLSNESRVWLNKPWHIKA